VACRDRPCPSSISAFGSCYKYDAVVHERDSDALRLLNPQEGPSLLDLFGRHTAFLSPYPTMREATWTLVAGMWCCRSLASRPVSLTFKVGLLRIVAAAADGALCDAYDIIDTVRRPIPNRK
jgi:hypothetical protein